MIYLDNAATTQMYKECLQSFEQYGVNKFFNMSALYQPSVEINKTVKAAREAMLNTLHGNGDILFTASGTEADNMALFGAKKPKNGKIIVSDGEHSAVYNTAMELKNRGYNVEFAAVNPDGSVNIDMLKSQLSPDVCLVSIMHVNNETGAVNDLKTIGKLIRQFSPDAVFHSDGVQAVFKVNVNLKDVDVDLYSISGHKFHAPKGIGALYIKNGVRISPTLFGGGQEKGLRPATENVAAIDALRVAFEINAKAFKDNYAVKRQNLEYLRQKMTEIEGNIIISPENSPHILMCAFKGVRGEVLMHSLEKYGIYIGIGSACSSKHGNRFQSHLGLDDAHKEGVVRVSLSEFNTTAELDSLVEAIETELKTLQKFKRV